MVLPVVMWVRGSVIATVLGTGSAQGDVEAIARAQHDRLGRGTLGGDDDSSSTGVIVISLALAALVAAVVVAAVIGSLRRKRVPEHVVASPPSGPAAAAGGGSQGLAAGWYPIAGNPHHQVYWDGAAVRRQARWTGTEWVDASRLAPPAASPWAPESGAVDRDRQPVVAADPHAVDP